MVFNDDFVKTLHHNGRLPIDSLEKQQKLLKKLKLKDQKIEELKKSMDLILKIVSQKSDFDPEFEGTPFDK